jgi:hypothetical protein
MFIVLGMYNFALGLRKSFLNQTTYVLKNQLLQQSFLNRDSFLNPAFLDQVSTVPFWFILLDWPYVSIGVTCTTTVEPKFSDTLTLSPLRGGADSTHHRRRRK